MGDQRHSGPLAEFGRVLVYPLPDASDDLAAGAASLDPDELYVKLGRVAISVALHRSLTSSDYAAIELARVDTVEHDDELIARAMNAMAVAVPRLTSIPTSVLAAAIARATRHPELAPLSYEAVRRFAIVLDQEHECAVDLAALLEFTRVLLARADGQSNALMTAETKRLPETLRWDLIEIATVDAVRARDVDRLISAGESLLRELVRATVPRFSVVRHWLSSAAHLQDQTSNTDDLIETQLQINDALTLREDEPSFAAFLEALPREPVESTRRSLLRELWGKCLNPQMRGMESVLGRIRDLYGEVSPHEHGLASLGENLRWESGPDGFFAATELLRQDVSTYRTTPLARIPWVTSRQVRIEESTQDYRWEPSEIFVATVVRTVVKGRMISEEDPTSAAGAAAEELLDAVLCFVADRGGSSSLLEQSSPLWQVERQVHRVEKAVLRKNFDEAGAVWSEMASNVARRAMAEELKRQAEKLQSDTFLTENVAHLLAALLVDATDGENDDALEATATAIVGLAEEGFEGPLLLPGLRAPDGSVGPSALETFMRDVDRFVTAADWRRAMRSRLGSFRPILAEDLEREQGLRNIASWVVAAGPSGEDVLAHLMLAMLEKREPHKSLENLKQEGWFERELGISNEGVTWAALHNAQVEEMLDLLTQARHVLDEALSAVDVATHDVIPDLLRNHSPVEDGMKRLGTKIAGRAQERLRLRSGNSEFGPEVRSTSYALRVIVTELLAIDQFTVALGVITQGQRLMPNIGHSYVYMDFVQMLVDSDRAEEAATLLETIAGGGGHVDLFAITTVVSQFMRRMTTRLVSDPNSEEAKRDLELIESLVAPRRGFQRPDAVLYSRLIRANALVGRLDRCEELAAQSKQSGQWDRLLDIELIRARAREGSIASVEEAVREALSTFQGEDDAVEMHLVVARSFGSAGRIQEGWDWICSRGSLPVSRDDLFQALVAGVALAGWHHSYVGKRIDLEDLRFLHEGMYNGEFPLSWPAVRELLTSACKLAISGNDSERLVVAQETSRLMVATSERLQGSADENVIEQLCWVVKWTRSGKLAQQAVDAVESAGLPWTPARAGRLIEALAYSEGVDLARRLLRASLKESLSDTDTIYLYNVFLSVLRGRAHEKERNEILREMQDQGLQLDRFSRAELGLALAAGRAFSDETRMLRSSTAVKWQELVGPLREGAELFEPIVARLRLELRTLSRALAAGRPHDVLKQRCDDVATISRELAETTKTFQESVSLDASGQYDATRYAITSDIVHELSQPSVTLAFQVRELRTAIETGDNRDVGSMVEELMSTAKVLGLKLKSYRESLAAADSDSFGEEDVSVHRAFVRAVDSLDLALVGDVQIMGADGLRRDHKYDRELVVRGNSYLMQRAFHAMLTNSLEAMRAAGVTHPTIQVEGLYHPGAMIEAARLGTVQFSISDNGPGIPSEIAEQIFKAGFTTRRQRGLGLGLATVASIVEVHGGVIQLVDPARARFILVFPAADLGRGGATREGISPTPGVAAGTGQRPIRGETQSQTESRQSEPSVGVIVMLRTNETIPGETLEVNRPMGTRGTILMEGLDAPITFTTRDSSARVGCVVSFTLRQLRVGWRAEGVVVQQVPPAEPRVTGIIEQAPSEDLPIGFIYVPEMDQQVVFFPGFDLPELEAGDIVSAIIVPGYDWKRRVRGSQAIDIRRV